MFSCRESKGIRNPHAQSSQISLYSTTAIMSNAFKVRRRETLGGSRFVYGGQFAVGRHRLDSGSPRGYGWPATLELLSPPIGKPVDSCQTIKMNICPACGSVHEIGGICVFHRPSDSPFNGYIDDLTLWNRSLGQGEVRALNYLDRGLNGIVVPRGLFFQSQFFSNLNTTAFSQSSPVVGSTVMGNDNPGELNALTVTGIIKVLSSTLSSS